MTDHLRLLAKEAKDCTTWTQHCGASCCQEITLHFPGSNPYKWFKGATIRIPLRTLFEDEITYLSLHNGVVKDGELRFTIGEHAKKGCNLTLYNRCNALKNDLSCGIYPGRPLICRRVNDDDVKNKDFGKAYLTKNCLYKYKLEEQK